MNLPVFEHLFKVELKKSDIQNVIKWVFMHIQEYYRNIRGKFVNKNIIKPNIF